MLFHCIRRDSTLGLPERLYVSMVGGYLNIFDKITTPVELRIPSRLPKRIRAKFLAAPEN